MPQDGHLKRAWEEIAQELTQEPDAKRVIELAQELDAALAVAFPKTVSKAPVNGDGELPKTGTDGD
jgi:hypothetical protein